ncbi:PREDICTED: deoxyuridine 5'-triphosphate nucleotidohydrolase [Populus euphratica]|uniref:Deoxyuridine 5'-triphosphate nucleotidohydrolase n=1 Tax=Populus euphratica TaxID=75702 RepID=A0AAJ6U838_POPEU|nr:PREDICTED: deoxyuridine 5'-triphosphate nucleotidohydrolase [Populus euphratica]
MAGTFSAINWKFPQLAGFSLLNHQIPAPFRLLNSRFCYPRNSQVLKMAPADLQNHSPDVKEPSPKLPKLQHDNIPSYLLRVKKLSENAVLPSRGSPLSAGYDLSSASKAKVPARGKALIPTDLSIAIPEGTYARIAPRSGLTWKHSIDVGAGVIDADYRGPVGVILFNHSDLDFEVKVGDRIAQLIIEKIVTPNVMEVEDLDATVRGAGGFGSTGV